MDVQGLGAFLGLKPSLNLYETAWDRSYLVDVGQTLQPVSYKSSRSWIGWSFRPGQGLKLILTYLNRPYADLNLSYPMLSFLIES